MNGRVEMPRGESTNWSRGRATHLQNRTQFGSGLVKAKHCQTCRFYRAKAPPTPGSIAGYNRLLFGIHLRWISSDIFLLSEMLRPKGHAAGFGNTSTSCEVICVPMFTWNRDENNPWWIQGPIPAVLRPLSNGTQGQVPQDATSSFPKNTSDTAVGSQSGMGRTFVRPDPASDELSTISTSQTLLPGKTTIGDVNVDPKMRGQNAPYVECIQRRQGPVTWCLISVTAELLGDGEESSWRR